MDLKNIYGSMGISPEIYDYCEAREESLRERFRQIDRIFELNQLKVLSAMQESKVSEACLVETTGYGYNDIGRDRLEEVYARVFRTEDALVRSQIVCGTHALATALSAIPDREMRYFPLWVFPMIPSFRCWGSMSPRDPSRNTG